MIKVEHVESWGFEHAVRGMRNPMNSWDKSDSKTVALSEYDKGTFIVGGADLDLMHRLIHAGTEHRKFLRQVMVSMDITAPLYWWKEYDTYKVGTVANSCSTMHKIQSKEFLPSDFSLEHLDIQTLGEMQVVMNSLNRNRLLYLDTKDKQYWWNLIQMLPTCYNQKRTVTFNYENALTMIHQRIGHKLDEWNDFVEILKGLPYMDALLEGDGHEEGH